MAKSVTAVKELPERPLVFIDTNIFLDCYRAQNEMSLGLLKKLVSHQKNIITTDQVFMEFLKNRQTVLMETKKTLGANIPPIQVPAFLRHKEDAKNLEDAQKKTKSFRQSLTSRVDALLTNPVGEDPVFSLAVHLFERTECRTHLARPMKERHEIRELAEKRWRLGYPPRKDKDTSLGDAINWEWIVHCASSLDRDVVIVSRDGDFGVNDGKGHLNDWLAREFKDRVGRDRNIELTLLISEALKRLGGGSTQAEISKEQADIDRWFVMRDQNFADIYRFGNAPLLEDLLRKMMVDALGKSPPLPRKPDGE